MDIGMEIMAQHFAATGEEDEQDAKDANGAKTMEDTNAAAIVDGFVDHEQEPPKADGAAPAAARADGSAEDARESVRQEEDEPADVEAPPVKRQKGTNDMAAWAAVPALKVVKMFPEAKLPARAHPMDAGLDLCYQAADGPESVDLRWGEVRKFPTGLRVAIPPGYVGRTCERSSMGSRGVTVHGGVNDAGYTGQLFVMLQNCNPEPTNSVTDLSEGIVTIKKGQRIAQLLVQPVALPQVEEVEELEKTARGEGAFGSSGDF